MTNQPKQIETWKNRFRHEFAHLENAFGNDCMPRVQAFIASERIKLLEEIRALVEEKSYWLNDGVEYTETVVSSDDLLAALKTMEENL